MFNPTSALLIERVALLHMLSAELCAEIYDAAAASLTKAATWTTPASPA